MTANATQRVGFACAYTPLPLIHAAGFRCHRMLPITDAPDRAGALLHDNLCPHVKRILDRALASDLPPLAGVVLMGSCDAMRRLADAWPTARPDEPLALLDLPTTTGPAAVDYLARELRRLRDLLQRWSGAAVSDEAVARSVALYHRLARALQALSRQPVPGGAAALQALYNRSVLDDPEQLLGEVQRLAAEPAEAPAGVPVYLFGNVLPQVEAFELLEQCGARVVGDDLCTGARQLAPLELAPNEDPLRGLARSLLARPPCARTLDPARPLALAGELAEAASQHGARGVIVHVMKFCDPYLNRLPAVQQELAARSIPMLMLEGDCTQRSLGQHRTRIEAFIEMLG